MPLTNAEKQRRYKEKLRKDPEKYNEYKKKQRENYHAKKRLTKDLNPKERYNARVIWRLRKKNQRERARNLHRVLEVTPPSSPLLQDDNLQDDVVQNERDDAVQNKNDDIDREQNLCASPIVSEASKRGRKQVKRDRSKMYRENIILKKENEKLKQKYEKYKKKLQRTKKKLEKKEKKEKKTTEKEKYETLSNAIKDKYIKLKNRRDKNAIKSVFDQIDQSLKKNIAKDALGLTGNLRTTANLKDSATQLKKEIEDFYNRDDVSRPTAGRKETVTKNKTKVQKRFLLDTMKNLYHTFKQENPETKCSYFYFTRNKPFYVVKPSIDGREMCLCKTHTNPVYKAQELKKHRIIDTDDLNTLFMSTVCDPKRQSCMYGTCQECCNSEITYDTSRDKQTISWNEWIRKEVTYKKEEKTMKTIKNVKETKKGTVKNLMKEFNKEIKALKKHVFNIKTQYKCFREAIDNIKETEVVVVADFSENYNGKYHAEIQAHQFGGSREQVSLHTVVTYVKGEGNRPKVDSYCTVSSCTNHQPAAIWTHLDPILKNIREKYPEIKTVHFFTDGPFSQYRQKQNFYLCSTKTFDYEFTAVTWNFFEAGHGKGPADGIGGFLKRKADEIVAAGTDVPTAKKFFEVLKGESKIQLYMVTQETIEATGEQLPKNIKPLQGTLQVHQIFTEICGELKYRTLGCFCNRGFCGCLQPKTYRPLKDSLHNIQDKNVDNMDTDMSDSGSDNTPLNRLQHENEINIPDLFQPRNQTVYDLIYSPKDSDNEPDNEPAGSSGNQIAHSAGDFDDEQAGSSGNKISYSAGDYLLVNVRNHKGKTYRYVCIVDDLEDDGEIRVIFFRCVKNGKIFRLDKSDISYIDHLDIISSLPKPEIETKRGQTYYKFKDIVDVFEK